MSFGVIIAPLCMGAHAPLREVERKLKADGFHTQWDARPVPFAEKREDWKDTEFSVALLMADSTSDSMSSSVWALEEGLYGPNYVTLEEAVSFIYETAGIEQTDSEPETTTFAKVDQPMERDEDEERTTMATAFATASAEPGGIHHQSRKVEEEESEIQSWPVGDDSWWQALSPVRRASLEEQVREGCLGRNVPQAVILGDRIYHSIAKAAEDYAPDFPDAMKVRMQQALKQHKTEFDGLRFGLADERLEEIRLGFREAKPKEVLRPMESGANLVAMIVRGTTGELEFDRDFEETEAEMIVEFCRRVIQRREEPARRVRL